MFGQIQVEYLHQKSRYVPVWQIKKVYELTFFSNLPLGLDSPGRRKKPVYLSH